ncbi:ly6/PLAUR domain-containing protein 3-like [Engystomops pustulosus]|uniref:ly6/PLAUR domain-containing protein 3-like n=1 Tax=Engystomops pustulosus TaxID=76066 RepID=UPI003AFA7CDE
MKMKRTSAWGGSALMLLGLVFTLGLQDVTLQPLECYSCTDRGDGSCLPENAANISCTEDHNVCEETISAIRTSHDSHVVLKKGCGYGTAAKLNQTISFHGISIFIQMNQCNSSFCNGNLTLRDPQLSPEDNITRVPTDDQCYICMGRPGAECTPSNAPVLPCYETYSHCFDGNLTISLDNDTTLIHIKSCAMSYRCEVQTVTYGSTSYEIKGACCSGERCNLDLSNSTQLEGLPFLEILHNDIEEPTTTPTAAPPPSPTPTHTQPTPTDTQPTKCAPQRSSYQGCSASNGGTGLLHTPWLILLLSLF